MPMAGGGMLLLAPRGAVAACSADKNLQGGIIR